MTDIDLISAIVRGDPASAPALAAASPRTFIDSARREGMLPLVADRVAAWPAAAHLAAELRAEAAGFVAADLAREQELRRALDALAAQGVQAVLFKGAALAYTHYARPDLRPRDDSDLIVPPDAREAAHAVLAGLGYRPVVHVTGALVSYQAIYEKVHGGAVVHVIDLHWRIANPQLFADVLTVDELQCTSLAIPALGPSARGPSAPHALFLACVHRVAHHRDEKLLVWIHDIHLIASRLTAAEWDAFLDLADRREMKAICRQGLDLAIRHFDTAIPASVLNDPRLAIGGGPAERSASFLRRDRAQLATFVSDVRALRSWTDRARLLREHLCPSSAYMRQVYAPSSRAPLPALYLLRAARGAWRWIARA